MTITAAADGSALGNPGPAGWAWYIDDDRWAAGGWKRATNNIGELTAVLELFRATAHVDEDLLVLCHSQYVINSVTKWMPGWKKKGWRKADGAPVLNRELLEQLDEAVTGRRYRFEWVKGHVGHELNEAADVRARAAAESYQRGTEVPAGPGFGGPTPATPVRSQTSRASTTGSSAAPAVGSRRAPATALFDFDEPETRGVTLQLSPDEYARLLDRARSAGRTPEELLRGLI